ncbi:MAG: cupredoxin domain-containing protein [Acidobacteria bacterium]|nr:cupredoxin domain-containing protein [Acidobacteriota bacterium]MDA1233896.1 cupredoxin domain-containing protein [Acidobacteriota bacterium]
MIVVPRPLSLVLTAILTVAGLFAVLAVSLAQEKPEVREIAVTAKKYEFSPSEIRVRQGESVKLSITALDRKHGFKIEALEIDRELPKGEVVTIEFIADSAGTFPIACSKFCGFGHKRMKGQLVVE